MRARSFANPDRAENRALALNEFWSGGLVALERKAELVSRGLPDSVLVCKNNFATLLILIQIWTSAHAVSLLTADEVRMVSKHCYVPNALSSIYR
jgi:hypothetical protein